jgi:C-terminal processing protease CtpA/Prc
VNDDPEVFFVEDDEESDFGTGTAYDIFAPPGPIGVVVDTTQAGPIVHSLKKSSPMQGLISPGDLILALDGKDVRRMNAATFTRLMAKRYRAVRAKVHLDAA